MGTIFVRKRENSVTLTEIFMLSDPFFLYRMIVFLLIRPSMLETSEIHYFSPRMIIFKIAFLLFRPSMLETS